MPYVLHILAESTSPAPVSSYEAMKTIGQHYARTAVGVSRKQKAMLFPCG